MAKNKSQTEKAELLAPAGSMSSLKAAIQAGADAVYMGGQKFGARAFAENADETEWLSAIDYVHLHGKKLYLTLNTLVKDSELEKEIYLFLKPLYLAGLDAVIVQDLGLLTFIKGKFPSLPIHASTQMTITGSDGAGLVRKLGASRIVTARELSLKEIKAISDSTDVEIETFIHGALCYCYSGQCLMSSMIGGRSGNRGRCGGTCRLPFNAFYDGRKLNRKEEIYPLSLKDLCSLPLLPQLLMSGVYSLKIEGRMKGASYTAGVVSIYRKYLDLYLSEGINKYAVDPEDMRKLSSLFDRGGSTLSYFNLQSNRDMVVLKEKTKYRKVDTTFVSQLESDYLETERIEKIKGIVTLFKEFPARIEVALIGTDYKAVVNGAIVQRARMRPLDEDSVRKQLGKTGGTPFEWDGLDIQMEDDVFLPIQELNELRRRALTVLGDMITESYHRKLPDKADLVEDSIVVDANIINENDDTYRNPKINVYISSLKYLDLVLARTEVTSVYIDITCLDMGTLYKVADRIHRAGKILLLAMPHIFRKEAREFFIKHSAALQQAGADGYLVKNLDEAGFLSTWQPDARQIWDHSLYTFNKIAKEAAASLGAHYVTAPLELNKKELAVRGSRDTELIVYGYYPVMVSAGSVTKTLQADSCNTGTEKYITLSDRKNKVFTVVNNSRFSYDTIYNSVPFSLLDAGEEVKVLSPASIRIQFTIEDTGLAETILDAFIRVYSKGFEIDEELKLEFTRGHFRRGVE